MTDPSVNVGKTQIDMGLLQELKDANVPDEDARELARVDCFGGVPAAAWITGLKTCAKLSLDPTSVHVDPGFLLNPWHLIAPALMGDGQDYAQTIINTLGGHEDVTKAAVLEAVNVFRSALAAEQQEEIPLDPRRGLTTKQARQVVEEEGTDKLLRIYDPKLVKVLMRLLNPKPGSKAMTKDQARRVAGEQMIQWMADHGRFIQTRDKVGYYLFRDERELYPIKSHRFLNFLYRATCVNPASDHFGHLLADVQAVCDQSPTVEVVKAAHYDRDTQVVRISVYNGTVLRLDGYTVAEEANGDGPVIFEDSLDWTPFKPDYSAQGKVFEWWAGLPNFANECESYELLMKAWVVCTFFTELCPTRPLLVLYGVPGSGKSMAFRVLVKFLYGPNAQIQGMPDKEDGFTVGVSTYPVFILDNMDRFDRDLQDKLALVATGGEYTYRKLYTDKDHGKMTFRSWLGVTSRTPDTLRRADLVDRCCIVPVSRIAGADRGTESSFLLKAIADRNKWWGDVILAIQDVLRAIKCDGIPEHSSVRMADFEALARLYARSRDEEHVWDRVILNWSSEQADLLLTDSPILEALEVWLDPTTEGQWFSARDLHSRLEAAMYAGQKPDSSWPRSVIGFGRMLAEQMDTLRRRYKIEHEGRNGRNRYKFERIPEQGSMLP